MKNKIYIIFPVIIFSALLFSCRKDYLNVKPPSTITSENAIYDNNSANQLILGVYGTLRHTKIYTDRYLKFCELSSDDATYDEGLFNPFDALAVNSTIDELGDMWLGCYEGIQRSNYVLEALSNAKNLDKLTVDNGYGEAYFMRAYYYWLLVTTFGEVPIYTQLPTAYEDLFKKQQSVDDVYNQIESDLRLAEGLLPISWEVSSTGRATQAAAKAMLGKVYLYRQKWVPAKEKLQEALSSAEAAGKSLSTDFKNVFSYKFKNGIESIFEIQCQQGAAANQDGVYYNDGGGSGLNNWRTVLVGQSSAVGNFQEIIATRDIFNEFEKDDIRLFSTFFIRGVDTITIYQPYPTLKRLPFGGTARVVSTRDENGIRPGAYFLIKKGINGDLTRSNFSWDFGDNIITIRYSDVLLMLAEAQSESEDLGAAKNSLNRLRNARNRPPFPYTVTFGGHTLPAPAVFSALKFAGQQVTYNDNLDDFRKALVHERRVELAFEYHRFNDIRRWAKIPNHPGSAFKVFEEKKNRPYRQTAVEDFKEFKNANMLFPKPQNEIDKSQGALIQNPN